MQAFEIRYSRDESRVALGWPGGLLVVHAVVPEDGSPGEEIAQVIHHKATLVHVGWVDDATLASVSADGSWAVSDAATGEVRCSGSVGGEYVRGALSPSGKSLFLFTYEGNSKAYRVRTDTGEQAQGPDVNRHLSVTSRVFPLDDDLALYHFVRDDYETEDTQEGFAYVDFASGTVKTKRFATGPTSDFDDDTRLMMVDPVRGLGVRPDYAPIELDGDEETGHVVVRAEVFDARTLEQQSTKVVFGWPRKALQGPYEALGTAEPGSEEFMEAQDWMVRKLCSAGFVRDSEHLWFGISQGAVRRISLADDERSVIVIHGGGADTGPPTLDDVFARNLMNNYTLGVSPSGAYVGFGNPNDFFSIEAIGLEGAEDPIKLSPRATAGKAVEAPGLVRFAGDGLVVFDRGHRMFIADGTTGEPKTSVELDTYYGNATDVARSDDGRWLAIAVSGGESFAYDFESGDLLGLPMPPHGIRAAFVGGARLVMAHYAGAVMVLDFDAQESNVIRAPDEEGQEPDEEWEAFEQRYDVYASTPFSVDGTPHFATVDENDALQIYVLPEGTRIEVGPELDQGGRRLVGGDGWLAAATRKNVVQVLRMPSGEKSVSHTLGKVGALAVGETSGALYAFDDASGELLELARDADERTQRFEYRGPAVASVQVSERLGRIALVTASGEIELRDLQTGDIVATLHVRPIDDGRELVRD